MMNYMIGDSTEPFELKFYKLLQYIIINRLAALVFLNLRISTTHPGLLNSPVSAKTLHSTSLHNNKPIGGFKIAFFEILMSRNFKSRPNLVQILSKSPRSSPLKIQLSPNLDQI